MPRTILIRTALVAAALGASLAAGLGTAQAADLRLENVNGMQQVVGTTAPATKAGSALRLENKAGMQVVIYDSAAPARGIEQGGTPRIVVNGGGDISVAYSG